MSQIPSHSGIPPPAAAGWVIVCERTGQWAAALRRELTTAGVHLAETRSLKEAWESLATAPASMLIIELTAGNVDSLLRRMAWLARDFPRARLAIVASRRLSEYQWLLREAGAVHFLCSPRRIGSLAELAMRHMAAVPMPQQTLVERIWDSLPWAGRQ